MRSPLRARPDAHCACLASAMLARPRSSAVLHTLSPHPRSCGWPLRRRKPKPSQRPRRQQRELERTQQQPQPSWHIRLQSPPPTCPTATSARGPPLNRPASHLSPVFRYLTLSARPHGLLPWQRSVLVFSASISPRPFRLSLLSCPIFRLFILTRP